MRLLSISPPRPSRASVIGSGVTVAMTRESPMESDPNESTGVVFAACYVGAMLLLAIGLFQKRQIG
jgi:hypothetical protein